MPMKPSKLGDAISKIRQRGKGTAQQVASDWARAVTGYAADAISTLGGKPLDLSASQSVLEGFLTTAFASTGGPTVTAVTIADGLAAFWLPVIFSGTVPGAVTAMGPPAGLASALQATWASNFAGQIPDQQAANNVAKAIDAWTRTVIVTHPTAPSPTVGPIS